MVCNYLQALGRNTTTHVGINELTVGISATHSKESPSVEHSDKTKRETTFILRTYSHWFQNKVNKQIPLNDLY